MDLQPAAGHSAALVTPIEGGRYQVGSDQIQVLAIGRYRDQVAVVSRVNASERLAIWPMAHWRAAYGCGQLLGVDRSMTERMLRGCGRWLGLGLIVVKIDDEITLSEMEALDDGSTRIHI